MLTVRGIQWWGIILCFISSGYLATKLNQTKIAQKLNLERQKTLSECAQQTNTAEAFVQQGAQLESVERLHRIEAKLFDRSIDSPVGCFFDALQVQLDQEASRLVYLTVDDSPAQKFHTRIVFDCSELEGLICRGRYADDTGHTLEFPEAYQVVPFKTVKAVFKCHASETEICQGHYVDKPAPTLRVKVDPRYALTQMDFYTGNHDAMHGITDPKKLNIQADGTLNFQFLGPEKEQVMFAIVKGKGDHLYKKYVWVVSR